MTKTQKLLSVIFAAVILAFLSISFLLNFSLAEEPLSAFISGEIDLKEFTKQIQEIYKSDVDSKNSYININGLFARISGRQIYNEVVRLNNGMLTYSSIPVRDMDAFADGIADFDSFLESNGIEYVFLQCPIKSDINDELVPVGVENYGNSNANLLISNFDELGVEYIDFRPALAGSVEQIEKYFYDTDHHWNADASFYAYKEIISMLKTKFPDAKFDDNALLESSWTRTVYEDWFLGSHGKRVGEYFAGVDDFILYTPNFATDMSMYIPKHKSFTSGTFEQTLVKSSYLDEPNYFDETPYCTYTGGDYPLVHHVNYNAKNDIKVLIIKDSFTLATQAFLSTQVREVDVIDPRYYTDMSIAEYVAASSPDIVLTMINPTSFQRKEYCNIATAGAEAMLNKTAEKQLGEIESIKVTSPEDKTNKNFVVTDYISDEGVYDLRGGEKYKLSIGDVKFYSGSGDGFTVALYDTVSGTIVSSYAFDSQNKNESGTYEWSFFVPKNSKAKYKLVVYAGLHGKTNGNTVEFENVVLSRFVK